MDNLNTHTAMDVLLFALAHPRWEFVFQPVYAAYLNLLEIVKILVVALLIPVGFVLAIFAYFTINIVTWHFEQCIEYHSTC